jgi:UDP-N-acetyl-2-amino-2-deoxyglucuronate dehydrogenase
MSIPVAVITEAGGAHLDSYFPALAAAKEAESVVLADASGASEPLARKILGDKLRHVYRDRDELLNAERPGMALVSMEAVHAPPAIQAALAAGWHVLAEKPACLRAEDFAPLVRLAQSKHLHLMLALANRISPPIVAARKLLQSGEIGKLYGMELHLIADQTRLQQPAYRNRWVAQKDRAGGGHLAWLGIHWLDLAMYMTAAKIVEVAGFVGNVGGQPLDVEDSAAMTLRLDNGILGTLTSGYYVDKGYHMHLKFWGSQGWIEMDPRGSIPFTWYNSKMPDAKPQSYSGPTQPTGYTPFVEDALRACAGLQEPPVTAEESLYVLQTLYACYQAAATGRTQHVG